MVKPGSQRSQKFAKKYDVDVIMLRIKALQNFSIDKFVLPSQQAFLIDENLKGWINEAKLGYGARARLYDFLKKVVWKWENLTAEAKNLLHAQWLEQDLPDSLWQKIEAKHNEITTFKLTHNSKNIIVKYETDVFPYPQENVITELKDNILLFESDFPLNDEKLQEQTEIYTQNPWRQQRLTYGNCDYLYVWSQAKMDKTVNIELLTETVQPLLVDKTVFVNADLKDYAAGTVLFLPLDEGEGTITYDKSGKNNNGALSGGVAWTQGKYGKALNFDGINDFVDCGNDTSLDLTAALTVSCWVKIPSPLTGWVGIISKYEKAVGKGGYQIVVVHSTTVIIVRFGLTNNMQ